MVGIIVVGHGEFGQGLTSSIELIAGKQEHYFAIDFPQEKTPDVLSADIKEAIDTLREAGNDVLVFTDLMGATPFKESAELSVNYDNVRVIGGTNLAMLLEAALMRFTVEDFDDFVTKLVETGAQQVGMFDIAALSANDDNDDDLGDGI